ncbi:MAG: tetratricopeptide repeat protein [Deltaproteobacteria bacterium]|nr:tetratricopeptide repeat protein [Deltaproteobacteria bacterium]
MNTLHRSLMLIGTMVAASLPAVPRASPADAANEAKGHQISEARKAIAKTGIDYWFISPEARGGSKEWSNQLTLSETEAGRTLSAPGYIKQGYCRLFAAALQGKVISMTEADVRQVVGPGTIWIPLRHGDEVCHLLVEDIDPSVTDQIARYLPHRAYEVGPEVKARVVGVGMAPLGNGDRLPVIRLVAQRVCLPYCKSPASPNPATQTPGAQPTKKVAKPVIQSDSQGPSPSEADRRIAMNLRVVAKEPKSVAAWISLGNDYFDTRQIQRSIDAYGEALKLQPNNPDVLTDQGVMYGLQSNLDRALANYERAQELAPTHLASAFNIGLVYARRGSDPTREAAAWRRVIELAPDSEQAGTARKALQELGEAERQSALDSVPSTLGAQSRADIEKAILAMTQGKDDSTCIQYWLRDLNGDGVPEVFSIPQTFTNCGNASRCMVDLLTFSRDGSLMGIGSFESEVTAFAALPGKPWSDVVAFTERGASRYRFEGTSYIQVKESAAATQRASKGASAWGLSSGFSELGRCR